MSYQLGLGISILVVLISVPYMYNGMRRMIFSGNTDWLITGWTVVLFFVVFQYIYSSIVLQPPAENITVSEFLLLFGIAGLWTFIASLLYPADEDGYEDLEKHYFEHKNLIFSIAAFNIILNSVLGFILLNENFLDIKNGFRVLFLIGAIFLVTTEEKAWHYAMLFIIFLVPFSYFIFRF